MSLHAVASPPLAAVLEAGLERSLNLATWLLPSFFLIRSYSLYTASVLEEVPAKAFLNVLGLATVLLIVLVSYQELVSVVDALVHHLEDYLSAPSDWQRYLQERQAGLERPQQHFIYRISFSFCAALHKLASSFSQYVLRAIILEFRSYLLVFSTLVGPLAIAAHILPGSPQNALSSWLNLHLSTLCWGVTIALIDMLLAAVGTHSATFAELGRDLVSAGAFVLMYLFVGPLTSIYVGNMAGNAFFAAAAGASTRLAAVLTPRAVQAARILYRKMASR